MQGSMSSFFAKFIESGLVAAGIMAVAYLLTFFNMAGSLDAYNLPHQLVDIDIPSTIETVYKVVVNIWVLLPLTLFVALITRKLHTPALLRVIYLSTILVGTILFSVFMIDYFMPSNWILVGIIGAIWVVFLIRPLVLQRTVQGYRAKWDACYCEEEDAEKRKNLYLNSKVGLVCLLICILYYMSHTVYEYGKEEALAKEWHYIAHDYDDRVVVFESEWRYVLMSRDGDTLNNNYQIVRFDELGNLTYENTGRLLVEAGDPGIGNDP